MQTSGPHLAAEGRQVCRRLPPVFIPPSESSVTMSARTELPHHSIKALFPTFSRLLVSSTRAPTCRGPIEDHHTALSPSRDSRTRRAVSGSPPEKTFRENGTVVVSSSSSAATLPLFSYLHSRRTAGRIVPKLSECSGTSAILPSLFHLQSPLSFFSSPSSSSSPASLPRLHLARRQASHPGHRGHLYTERHLSPALASFLSSSSSCSRSPLRARRRALLQGHASLLQSGHRGGRSVDERNQVMRPFPRFQRSVRMD